MKRKGEGLPGNAKSAQWESTRSSLPTLTIAAACTGRTVAGVVAIQAHFGGEEPERKRPREFQRGSKAGACTLAHHPRVGR
jgi:hypothetical protein